MNIFARSAALVAIVAGLSAPAFAENKPEGGKGKDDPNRLICEKQEVLGSRLATRKVCLTKQQWIERRRDDRELVDRSQMTPCVRDAGC